MLATELQASDQRKVGFFFCKPEFYFILFFCFSVVTHCYMSWKSGLQVKE